MKKTLALLLAACLCIGLCGCAPIDELKEKSEKYDRYEDIILALEDEDYDAAISKIKDMKPAPEVMEVNLTMDNWDTYFEFVMSDDTKMIDKDGYGNVESASMEYEFRLKEGYEFDWEQESHYEIGYSYTRHGMVFKKDALTFDPETFTFTGDYISDCFFEGTDMLVQNQSNFVYIDAVNYFSGFAVKKIDDQWSWGGDQDENKVSIIETTIDEILSVEGTIYLLQES